MTVLHQDSKDWRESLFDLVMKRPIVIVRLSGEDYREIQESSNGLSRFTIARPRELFRNVRFPTACLVYFDEDFADATAHIGFLSKSPPDTSLEKRIKIERAQAINPQRPEDLVALLDDARMKTNLCNRLEQESDIVPLSPKLSAEIILQLAEIDGNAEAMRRAMAGTEEPKVYSTNLSLQQDAIRTALRVFGMRAYERARLIDTDPDGQTALQYIPIYEDVVIQEHARRIPGLSLTEDVDLTGRAVFEARGERLTVITANKLPLEEVFGVDLIYYNAPKKNIVMVQYKMLEPDKAGGSADWIYRPDPQLAKEISRMKKFSVTQAPGPLEYRINPQVFYLKFVRRDAILGKSTQTMPIDHYHVLERDLNCRGPKGGFKITYDTLGGRYLRQEAFVDLIRSGYIGAYADTTAALKKIVDATLEDGRAVVAAIQSSINVADSKGAQ